LVHFDIKGFYVFHALAASAIGPVDRKEVSLVSSILDSHLLKYSWFLIIV